MRKIAPWLALGIATVVIMYLLTSCGLQVGKQVDTWQTHGKGASVCDYEVAITYRTQFRTGEEGKKDFFKSVLAQIVWLWNNNYEPFDLEYKYGFDITRKLVLRFAVIKYRKNE